MGKNWQIFAVTPTQDTIHLIRINEWDFNWQGAYTFSRMQKIPQGSIIHTVASYDNTIDNPFNPSNPPTMSTWGEGTTDEMYLVGLSYVPYEVGDEHIIIDTELLTSTDDISISSGIQLYPPFPNPASDEVVLQYYIELPQEISIELYDINGVLTKTIIDNTRSPAGNHKLTFRIDDLAHGLYNVQLRTPKGSLTTSIIVLD